MKHSSTILVTEFVTHVVSLIGFRAYLGRLPQNLLKLKHSLEKVIEMGAQRIVKNNWRTKSIGQRLASWLNYGLVRFMIGITGYAPGKSRVK